MLEDFTKNELARIDFLYGNDFDGIISIDDVKLIARFEYARAKEDIESEKTRNESKSDMENNLETMQYIKDYAVMNLQELHLRSLSNLDRLEKHERPSIEDAQKNEIKIENRSVVSYDGKQK